MKKLLISALLLTTTSTWATICQQETLLAQEEKVIDSVHCQGKARNEENVQEEVSEADLCLMKVKVKDSEDYKYILFGNFRIAGESKIFLRQIYSASGPSDYEEVADKVSFSSKALGRALKEVVLENGRLKYTEGVSNRNSTGSFLDVIAVANIMRRNKSFSVSCQ